MARSFSTNADHLDNAAPAVTTLATGLTLSAWVKFSTVGLLQEILTLGSAATNANRWTINVSGTNFTQAQARDNAGTGSFANATLAITAGVWYLVTGTFTDDTNRAGYANGANKGTSAVLRPITAPTNTRVSANPAGNNPVTTGLIAHCAVWNMVLSDADVLALYTNLPSSVQVSNLVDYWPMTTGASPEPSIGFGGNSLTVTGTSFNSDDPYGFPPLLMGQAVF